MKRKKKDYMMSVENIEYIEQVKNENNLKYGSDSLDLIIREHRKKLSIDNEIIIRIKIEGEL